MHVVAVDFATGRALDLPPPPTVRLRFRCTASAVVEGRERVVALTSDDGAALALLEPGRDYEAVLTPVG